MVENNKTKIPQWVLNLMIILIITAYGFVFNSILDRVRKTENRVENINPILLQIQTDLSAIKTNLEWLMKK